jgi:hypothetical protein
VENSENLGRLNGAWGRIIEETKETHNSSKNKTDLIPFGSASLRSPTEFMKEPLKNDNSFFRIGTTKVSNTPEESKEKDSMSQCTGSWGSKEMAPTWNRRVKKHEDFL